MKTLQVIKSLNGRDEYVLLPMAIYRSLHEDIETRLAALSNEPTTKDNYVPFVLEEYIDNPIALARIKAGITQLELAERLEVSQAYISKLERQLSLSPKILKKVHAVL